VPFSLTAVSCAHEAACRLSLKILKVGKRGEEGRRATGTLVYEVLLEGVGMMQEYFEEGEGVGQGGGVVEGRGGC
jgi:hypothetical protein